MMHNDDVCVQIVCDVFTTPDKCRQQYLMILEQDSFLQVYANNFDNVCICDG